MLSTSRAIVTITETTLNLIGEIDAPTWRARYIIAEVYATNTMEMWALDHESRFD